MQSQNNQHPWASLTPNTMPTSLPYPPQSNNNLQIERYKWVSLEASRASPQAADMKQDTQAMRPKQQDPSSQSPKQREHESQPVSMRRMEA